MKQGSFALKPWHETHVGNRNPNNRRAMHIELPRMARKSWQLTAKFGTAFSIHSLQLHKIAWAFVPELFQRVLPMSILCFAS